MTIYFNNSILITACVVICLLTSFWAAAGETDKSSNKTELYQELRKDSLEELIKKANSGNVRAQGLLGLKYQEGVMA